VANMILWRRLDIPGSEFSILKGDSNGWELAGTAVFAYHQHPCKLDYRITCGADWRTIAAEVSGRVADREIALTVVTAQGSWMLNGVEYTNVKGCTDIDLGFSPSTNLLPIRRLALAAEERAEVCAAWLPFPSLEFEPLDQVYTREGETSFRYESFGGSFVRSLEVNAAGFVTHYPGLWHAEAAT